MRALDQAGAAAVVLYSLFEEQISHESRALDHYLSHGSETYPEALSYFPDQGRYNVGPEAYLEHLQRVKQAVDIPVIGSLNGSSPGGWVEYARKIEQAGADALELNIYWLPTDLEMGSGELEEQYLALVRDVRAQVQIPIALKLSPFFTALPAMARRFVEAGADGLVLFNRFYQPDFDLETLEVAPNLALSTSHDLRLPLRWIAILYGRIAADFALSSGVHSAEDVLKAVMAGANVTMLTSELLANGIWRLQDILDDSQRRTTMRDLIIIGGGAAGLSAAMYALGKQLDFLLIHETLGKAGTTQHLSNEAEEEYLAGAEAVRLFERRITTRADHTLRDQVAEVVKVSGVFQVITRRHGVQESRAVIVATGATPIGLEAPGARALLNQGLGYSVTTHAQLLQGRNVAVIGTTVRALRGVHELARAAAQIYLIAPDRAGLETPLARALLRLPNVTMLDGYEVLGVEGATNVEQVVVAREGQTRRLRVDAAFVDLGLMPNSGMVRRLVQTDPDGFIWVDERNATTCPGLFAAGDVTTAFGEQILIAIGDGARAALSAYDCLLPQLPVYELRARD